MGFILLCSLSGFPTKLLLFAINDEKEQVKAWWWTLGAHHVKVS